MSEQMVEGAGGKKGDSNGHIDEATECLGAEASAGGGKHFFFLVTAEWITSYLMHFKVVLLV